MWENVKGDATTKSTLFLIDAEDELANMQVGDSSNPQTYLTELKQHFELIIKPCDNLVEMGATISTTCFSTIIMSSLPPSYHSAI